MLKFLKTIFRHQGKYLKYYKKKFVVTFQIFIKTFQCRLYIKSIKIDQLKIIIIFVCISFAENILEDFSKYWIGFYDL